MPRATLSVQPVTRDGLAAAYTAPTVDGIAFANTQREFLHVKNASAGPVVVTIQTAAVHDGLAVADRAVSVPAAADRFIGPFPDSVYRQDDQSVYVDFDVIADVTVAVLKVVL